MLSRSIAYLSVGDFSHAEILLDDGRLLGARADSVGGAPPGVQIRTQDYAEWTRKVVIAVPCTLGQKTVALAFATAQIGKPYDPRSIEAFFLARDWRSPQSRHWSCVR